MEFLYFPEDKSEYIPGIISIIIIFLLSILIVRLLIKASRKEVDKLEKQGYPVTYKANSDEEHHTGSNGESNNSPESSTSTKYSEKNKKP